MDITKEVITKKLGEIKALFADEAPKEAPKKEKEFVDVKAADGTILRIEPAVEVGATVQVIAEDAELTDAADGEIELEDGSVITVESGVIANVVAVEAEMEVEEDKFDADKFKETLKAEIIAEVKTLIEGFAKSEDVDAIDEKFSTVTKLTTELVEAIADEPTEKETKVTHNPFRKQAKKNTLLERFENYKNNN